MTEKEAKAARCCGPHGCGAIREEDRATVMDHVKSFPTEATAALTALQMLPRYCIGEACMAWRWTSNVDGFCGYGGAL